MNADLPTIETEFPADEILYGGLVTGRLYLVVGRPGTGKTLLGMEFLQTGIQADETVLFVHGEVAIGDRRERIEFRHRPRPGEISRPRT